MLNNFNILKSDFNNFLSEIQELNFNIKLFKGEIIIDTEFDSKSTDYFCIGFRCNFPIIAYFDDDNIEISIDTDFLSSKNFKFKFSDDRHCCYIIGNELKNYLEPIMLLQTILNKYKA